MCIRDRISGKAARSVGEKLKTISKNHQVMVVTHSASIAAKGEYNYFIKKEVKDDKTYTNIKLLSELETIREIARISSGDITDISMAVSYTHIDVYKRQSLWYNWFY